MSATACQIYMYNIRLKASFHSVYYIGISKLPEL